MSKTVRSPARFNVFGPGGDLYSLGDTCEFSRALAEAIAAEAAGPSSRPAA